MVEKCANPRCQAVFRYFGRGRLFAFEVRSPDRPCKDVPRAICERNPSHATVCFWLCEKCARDHIVNFTAAGGMQVLARPAAKSAPLHQERLGPQSVPAVGADRSVPAEAK